MGKASALNGRGSGGQVFAALAQRIKLDEPLVRLKVALCRGAKGAQFPEDPTFVHALTTQDLYGRRNLKCFLERLTNAGKGKVKTDNLTIEHVLPQKAALAPEWQAMLGPDWCTGQARCLHKLGNLTLTGFNSELEARPFWRRKSMMCGVMQIALCGTVEALRQRRSGATLAERALTLWRPLTPDLAMISKVDLEDAMDRSADHSVANLKWTPGIEVWFEQVRAAVMDCSDEVVELPSAKSVVYRAPE